MHATREELGGEWGGMTTGIVTIPAGTDVAGLLRGLPDDQCPCPHWGYVISGQLIVRYPDHEEAIGAGEAYYMPPGHVPEYAEDTEVFEVSPTEDLNKVIERAMGNLGPGGRSCPLPGSQSEMTTSLRWMQRRRPAGGAFAAGSDQYGADVSDAAPLRATGDS
jgi:hypothetical protein